MWVTATVLRLSDMPGEVMYPLKVTKALHTQVAAAHRFVTCHYIVEIMMAPVYLVFTETGSMPSIFILTTYLFNKERIFPFFPLNAQSLSDLP